MRRLLLGALVVALGGHFALPALAANQAVTVADNFFAQSRVAVKPGESVTWNASGAGNPHDVNFEDGGLSDPQPPRPGPWTTARTFASAGVYRYYCQIHGGPGGQGMSGVVYVNAAGNLPPIASFTVSPSPVAPGQPVSFNASTSSDSDGSVAKYEWDLDGNGSFETDTGTTPMVSRSYAASATIVVKLKVTDNVGATDDATRPLRINTPPTASFTASSNPAQTGETVSFNGSGSSDPEATITRYQWDLDGDGSFETDTGPAATASRSYASPAALSVKLRVTDSDGVTGEATRALQINARPASVIVMPPLGQSTPQPPDFGASKKSLAVSKSGRFSYSFGAGPGQTGTINLRSVSKVRISARRQISLGTKRFTVPASGITKVTWKLSRRSLRTLERNGRIKFRLTVTLRNTAGLTRSAATTLTLKRFTR